MRQSILGLLFILTLGWWMEGAAVLRGKISLQNRGGVPVANAQVSVFGVNTVTSTTSGFFELIFPDKEPGDVVVLNVRKPGFEVVNIKDLEGVILRKNPDDILHVFMCRVGTWEMNVRRYYGILEKSINEEYEKRLKEIEYELIKGKDREILRLREERDAALAQVKKMAEEFARVNLEEASDLYKKAFEHFKQGDIDLALEVLSNAKLEQALKNAAGEEKKAMQRLEESRDARKQVAGSYKLKAKLSFIKLRFDEAETYFEKALEADPGEPGNYIDFIDFLYNQNKFQRGLEISKKGLSLELIDSMRALLLNYLGLIYHDTNFLDEAEKTYTEALRIRRKLVEVNPDTYLPHLATTLNNLGVLYKDTTRFDDAEKTYTEALRIRRKLVEVNPKAYLADLAITLKNLGTLYSYNSRFTEAETTYTEALEIFRILSKTNPDIYLTYVAITLNNLGIIYSSTMRFTEAEAIYKDALGIRRKLAKTNPDAYLPQLALMLVNFGNLYYRTNQLSEAEIIYTEALGIYRKLAETNPATYLKYVGAILNNLGTLYYKKMRLTEVETTYTEALRIYRKLAEANPDAYLPSVSGTLNNLGTLYLGTKRLREAEQNLNEALVINRKLAETNPDAYLPDVAMILDNLGLVYTDTKCFNEAKTNFNEALRIRKKLAKVNPDAYLPDLALTLNNLGLLEIEAQKYIDACYHLQKALDIHKKLALENPAAFELDLCQTVININQLYQKNKEACQLINEAIPSLLNQAITILKKYPQVPKAQNLLQIAGQLKDAIEKALENQ